MASSRSSALLPSRAEGLGCEQPRIFTAPLRPLTRRTTLGYALVDFAESVLGIDLMPWQKWLALHGLELLPDGSFRFRTIVLLVARQSGKSTFLQVLALFFLYCRGAQLVIGTAQSLDIAEEVWQGAVDMAQDVPELAAEIERVTMVNGKKALELRRGERYKVQSANRRGGRGLSGDLVMLDELREHQSWDAWAAVTKTTMAREQAQVWAASNAGDAASVVLAFLRRQAHLALGDPDALGEAAAPVDLEPLRDDSLAIFEWSAAPGCDVADRDGWAQANPALGHTVGERAIRSAMLTDPEEVFRTEVLCQWVDRSRRAAAIDPKLWAGLADPRAERGGGAVFGLDVAEDRTAALATVWRRPDGAAQVMLADTVPAHEAVARCQESLARWGGKVVAPRAFAADLTGQGAQAEELTPAEFAAACGAFADAVEAGQVRHGNQPELTAAVAAACWRTSGSQGERAFDLKAGGAAMAPLVAAVRALHGLNNAPAADFYVIGG